MVSYDSQGARSQMDFVLRGLKQEIEQNNIFGVKVPFNHPLLFARGGNSLVFRLPESGLVGKSSFYYVVPEEKDPNHRGYYMLAGYASGLREGSLELTVQSLRSMGFNDGTELFLPEMKEYSCKVNLWHPKLVHYTLVPDLSESGQYQVMDAEDFPFESHPAGQDLSGLYDEDCRKILQACRSGSYELTCAGHGLEEDMEPAIRHMFLIQFNDKQGRLVLADLNHLIIEKK